MWNIKSAIIYIIHFLTVDTSNFWQTTFPKYYQVCELDFSYTALILI